MHVRLKLFANITSLLILCKPRLQVLQWLQKQRNEKQVDLGDDEAATPSTPIAPRTAVIFSERAMHKVTRSKRLRVHRKDTKVARAIVAKLQRLQEEVETNVAKIKKMEVRI